MILDEEARARIKTLRDFATACRERSAEALAAGVAAGFFVARPSSVLHVPEGPQATMRVDLRLMNAVRTGSFAETCPVWPLRRREGSVYSFVSVGRTQNCDVWIPDESISKLHALVREKGGRFDIADAGSRNPTLVDGEPAPRRGEGDPRVLEERSELRLGTLEVVFFSAATFRELVLGVVGPAPSA